MTMSMKTRMIAHDAIAFGAGMLFAIGLSTAGMTRPGQVMDFLNLFGRWDPMPLIITASAVSVHSAVYFLLVSRRERPPFASAFQLPQRRDLDLPLLGGAALFGLGWGISGLCPGGASVSVASALSGTTEVIWFTVAMLVGMQAYQVLSARRAAASLVRHDQPLTPGKLTLSPYFKDSPAPVPAPADQDRQDVP